MTYREEEVDEEHPLTKTIEDLNQNLDISMTSIALKGLNLSDINEYTEEVVHRKAKDLATVLSERSQGNPLFLRLFLRTLYSEKLLYFDKEKGRWEWKLEEIEKMVLSANLAELAAIRFSDVPKRFKEILNYASCIGDKFDLESLSVVMDNSQVCCFFCYLNPYPCFVFFLRG